MEGTGLGVQYATGRSVGRLQCVGRERGVRYERVVVDGDKTTHGDVWGWTRAQRQECVACGDSQEGDVCQGVELGVGQHD